MSPGLSAVGFRAVPRGVRSATFAGLNWSNLLNYPQANANFLADPVTLIRAGQEAPA